MMGDWQVREVWGDYEIVDEESGEVYGVMKNFEIAQLLCDTVNAVRWMTNRLENQKA